MKVLFLVHQNDARSGVFAGAARDAGHHPEEASFASAASSPDELESYGAVVVFGGGVNVDEETEHPWLREEKRFLAAALERELPVLGVCLGAQLIADIAGARVGRSDRPEVGWHEVLLEEGEESRSDPVLGGLPASFLAFEWHFYEFALPEGAVPIAGNRSCLQAYRVGDRAWGIQFHAEVTRQTVAAWSQRYADEATEAGASVDRLMAETEANIGYWNQIGRSICGRFLAVADASETTATAESERWIVDGMNLIGSRPDGWWRDRAAAMARLAEELDAFASRAGAKVTVVFDGRPVELPALSALDVRFAGSNDRNAADDEIARLVRQSPDPGSLEVVTSDGELVERAREAGARVMGTGGFRRRLEEAG